MLNQIKDDDPHYAVTKLLCLENTFSGQVQPQSELDELARSAHSKNLKVHLDGARLFNAHIKTGLSQYCWGSLFWVPISALDSRWLTL